MIIHERLLRATISNMQWVLSRWLEEIDGGRIPTEMDEALVFWRAMRDELRIVSLNTGELSGIIDRAVDNIEQSPVLGGEYAEGHFWANGKRVASEEDE